MTVDAELGLEAFLIQTSSPLAPAGRVRVCPAVLPVNLTRLEVIVASADTDWGVPMRKNWLTDSVPAPGLVP